MNNIKLDEISVLLIDIVPAFNVREDFGDEETKDLEESLKVTNGNIQPIIVCKKNDRYELISGERRLRALKSSGFEKALVIVYDNLTDLQKTQLMFNENLGRKHLTWQEELKALRRLQQLGHEIDPGFLENQKLSKQKIWSLLEGLQAVEEYPELLKEKTRKLCILKYRKIKREETGVIKDSLKVNLSKIVKDDAVEKEKIDTLVIDELKKEVKYYKENIFDAVKKSDKIERLSNGIWLRSEVKQLIEASRACEDFGKLDEKVATCKKCQKEELNIYTKCEFYRDEIENA